VAPGWVTLPPDRPRVCVTLGSVLPALGGVGALRAILTSLSTMDIEILLAAGDIDVAELGELPANVRPLGWMPLNALMPTCDAIVHHGGSATVMTPLAYGVPQVALPKFADQPLNAKLMADRGVGLTVSEPEQVADALSQVLGQLKFQETATEVRDEIAWQPSPAEVVGRLAKLV
jgi:UDP:flavonoid glycosyltransferase YjiC (YdhE family)